MTLTPQEAALLPPHIVAGLNPDTLERVLADPEKREAFFTQRLATQTRLDTLARLDQIGVTAEIRAGLNQETLNRVITDPDKAARFIELTDSRPTFEAERDSVLQRLQDFGSGVGQSLSGVGNKITGAIPSAEQIENTSRNVAIAAVAIGVIVLLIAGLVILR